MLGKDYNLSSVRVMQLTSYRRIIDGKEIHHRYIQDAYRNAHKRNLPGMSGGHYNLKARCCFAGGL